MLNEKLALHTPGPTPIPPQVAAAMARPMINHRGEAFSAIYRDVAEKLQPIFQTREQIYVIPGSGSSGWETAMVNFVPVGARVLNIVIGDFGERWVKANKALGFEVARLDYAAGSSANPADVAALLGKEQGTIKAVCLQQNETSTGVFNPVREIAAEAAKHGALVIVDAISSLGAFPFAMDEWGVDIVFTGSQKALMCPPGLMLIAASQRAWKAAEQIRNPRFYLDLHAYRQGFERAQTPYTPALSLYYGLQAALEMLHEEGLANVQERHYLMGKMCREAIKTTGLELLRQDEQFASPTVTAVKFTQGIAARTFRSTASKVFGVVLAGGQGALKETIFRIGHMGYITPNDVLVALASVENTLAYLGYPVETGKAVGAAQAVWLEHVRQER
ncbi:alanine--glyoxylate aminotransferase family protein [Ktedonosporobacter rubrisoli]|uniref:Tritium exchange subunit n=1 Tax=Ktedonosporobacter rubrisoli TaxID=2509675 RepID=A0A4P6JMA8_KTERU|nr:alanine--glyoxylate aminotransferase family protein [Ktedonosporobacter rubrisoli]QBD76152.1 alanine--glyoxylate aminotransferase family protein [Ktedonosporobacter rubrisoli]